MKKKFCSSHILAFPFFIWSVIFLASFASAQSSGPQPRINITSIYALEGANRNIRVGYSSVAHQPRTIYFDFKDANYNYITGVSKDVQPHSGSSYIDVPSVVELIAGETYYIQAYISPRGEGWDARLAEAILDFTPEADMVVELSGMSISNQVNPDDNTFYPDREQKVNFFRFNRLDRGDTASVKLFDYNGNEVFTEQYPVSSGGGWDGLSLDLGDLAEGGYQLEVVFSDSTRNDAIRATGSFYFPVVRNYFYSPKSLTDSLARSGWQPFYVAFNASSATHVLLTIEDSQGALASQAFAIAPDTTYLADRIKIDREPVDSSTTMRVEFVRNLTTMMDSKSIELSVATQSTENAIQSLTLYDRAVPGMTYELAGHVSNQTENELIIAYYNSVGEFFGSTRLPSFRGEQKFDFTPLRFPEGFAPGENLLVKVALVPLGGSIHDAFVTKDILLNTPSLLARDLYFNLPFYDIQEYHSESYPGGGGASQGFSRFAGEREGVYLLNSHTYNRRPSGLGYYRDEKTREFNLETGVITLTTLVEYPPHDGRTGFTEVNTLQPPTANDSPEIYKSYIDALSFFTFSVQSLGHPSESKFLEFRSVGHYVTALKEKLQQESGIVPPLPTKEYAYVPKLHKVAFAAGSLVTFELVAQALDSRDALVSIYDNSWTLIDEQRLSIVAGESQQLVSFMLPDTLVLDSGVLAIRLLPQGGAWNEVIEENFSRIDIVNASALQRMFGKEVKIVNRASGKALTVPEFSNTNGAELIQYDFLNTADQRWVMSLTSDQHIKITNVYSGKALEIADQGLQNGDLARQWDFFDVAHHQWQIEEVDGGYYKILSINSGKALEVVDGLQDNNAAIRQWDYFDVAHHQWQIMVVE